MIAHLVIDLDGTLLNSNEFIFDEDKEFLNKIHHEVGIIISSGRHLREIPRLIDGIELKDGDYIICCDGQYIYNAQLKCIFKSDFLNSNHVNEIRKKLHLRDFSAYTDENDYHYYNIRTQIKQLVYNFIKRRKSKVKRWNSHKKIDLIEKMAFQLPSDSADKLDDLKADFTVHRLRNNRIEILHKNTNKYYALIKLSEICTSFCLDNAILFGDDDNDLECFLNMKNTVAMANALDRIKNNAGYVTSSNDNHGVVNAIKRFKEKGLF